jgi:hypothetical protein
MIELPNQAKNAKASVLVGSRQIAPATMRVTKQVIQVASIDNTNPG